MISLIFLSTNLPHHSLFLKILAFESITYSIYSVKIFTLIFDGSETVKPSIIRLWSIHVVRKSLSFSSSWVPLLPDVSKSIKNGASARGQDNFKFSLAASIDGRSINSHEDKISAKFERANLYTFRRVS